jgi:predicted nucleic acid-binding protein
VNLVAANLPLYLEASRAEDHESAREWWDAQLSGSDPAGWCWPVLNAFMRIGTDARLNRRPLTLKEANERVRSWLDATLRPPGPADRPALDHFQQMLKAGNTVGKLVSDAHAAESGKRQHVGVGEAVGIKERLAQLPRGDLLNAAVAPRDAMGRNWAIASDSRSC